MLFMIECFPSESSVVEAEPFHRSRLNFSNIINKSQEKKIKKWKKGIQNVSQSASLFLEVLAVFPCFRCSTYNHGELKGASNKDICPSLYIFGMARDTVIQSSDTLPQS